MATAAAEEDRQNLKRGGNYQEFVGAKKHLVVGVSPDTGPGQESNAFAQWWKRSSGDGVAISAGIISLLAGR